MLPLFVFLVFFVAYDDFEGAFKSGYQASYISTIKEDYVLYTYQTFGQVMIAARPGGDFLQGQQDGSSRFCEIYAPRAPIFEESEVVAFLVRTLNDTVSSPLYHAGYITGWYEAWFESPTPPNALAIIQAPTTISTTTQEEE